MTTVSYQPWANLEKKVGQAYVHTSLARFRVVMAGRQSGKTRTGVAEICWDAMAPKDSRPHINWWVTQSYKVKDAVWRALLDFLPKEVIQKKNETELRIRLINGSEIFVKSADAPDSLVSESLDFVVCDEAGLWKEEAWSRGIGPMLTARPNAKVLFLGTPRSRNWFYKTWLKGRGEDPEYESFTWKSEDSPFADKKYLEERRRNMPLDLYREEFEADPLDSSGGVFKNVRQRVLHGAKSDQFSVIGVDLAQSHDFTAIIPMNSQRQALFVERSQEDYSIQKQRLARLCFEHHFARLVVDEANVGKMMVDELRTSGLPVEAVNTGSSVVKRAIIDNLRLAFENGTLTIPDDQVLIDELESYTYEVLPSGQIRYAAPDGGHDDTVIALALATWGQRSALFIHSQNKRSSYLGRTRGESYMKRSTNAA